MPNAAVKKYGSPATNYISCEITEQDFKTSQQEPIPSIIFSENFELTG